MNSYMVAPDLSVEAKEDESPEHVQAHADALHSKKRREKLFFAVLPARASFHSKASVRKSVQPGDARNVYSGGVQGGAMRISQEVAEVPHRGRGTAAAEQLHEPLHG
jgi:hypothetical protein